MRGETSHRQTRPGQRGAPEPDNDELRLPQRKRWQDASVFKPLPPWEADAPTEAELRLLREAAAEHERERPATLRTTLHPALAADVQIQVEGALDLEEYFDRAQERWKSEGREKTAASAREQAAGLL